jgi:hypothetical protein
VGKILIKCDYCNNLFEKEKGKVTFNRKIKNKNYCSPKCHSLGKQTGTIEHCAYCQKEIYCTEHVKQRQSKRHKDNNSGDNNYFCNQSHANSYNNRLRCQEKHPNFIDGHSTYRERALQYYGKKCTICDYDNVLVLEVHHRDRNNKNNKIENLDVLCPTHHTEYELGIRVYE